MEALFGASIRQRSPAPRGQLAKPRRRGARRLTVQRAFTRQGEESSHAIEGRVATSRCVLALSWRAAALTAAPAPAQSAPSARNEEAHAELRRAQVRDGRSTSRRRRAPRCRGLSCAGWPDRATRTGSARSSDRRQDRGERGDAAGASRSGACGAERRDGRGCSGPPAEGGAGGRNPGARRSPRAFQRFRRLPAPPIAETYSTLPPIAGADCGRDPCSPPSPPRSRLR